MKILVIATTLLGSALEYYDYMLFSLIMPTISQFFFSQTDKFSALVSGYLIILISACTRPIGALIFGYIGDKFSRKKALLWSMNIMAFSSFAISFMPGYAQIGILAPLGILFLRMLQTMSAGGELNGAAIFLIETISINKKGLASGLAWFSTVIGMFGAAIAADMCGNTEKWRYAFFIGGIIGLCALFLRFLPKTEIIPSFTKQPFKILKRNYLAVGLIASGISGMFYYNMIFLNAFWQHKLGDPGLVRSYNVYYFLVYSFCLLFSGFMSDKIKNSFKLLLFCSLALAVNSIPTFFYSCLHLHFINVMLLGVFVGPSHAILFMLFPPEYRYRGISISYGIGTSLIGGLTPYLCAKFSHTFFPGIWMIFVAILGFLGIWLGAKDLKENTAN